MSKYDNVNKPAHYLKGRKYEPRKVINDWGLSYDIGCAVKYLSRAGRKYDTIEDYEKAINYIQDEIRIIKKKHKKKHKKGSK